MYGPPRSLSSAHLADLVAGVGGTRSALALLDVTERTLRRWLASGNAPVAALRLLWYASPLAQREAALDLAQLLDHVIGERDALRAQAANLAQQLRAAGSPTLATIAGFARRAAGNDPVTPEVIATAMAFQQATVS